MIIVFRQMFFSEKESSLELPKPHRPAFLTSLRHSSSRPSLLDMATSTAFTTSVISWSEAVLTVVLPISIISWPVVLEHRVMDLGISFI